MEILIKRKEFTENSTISEWYVNGVFECYGIEDKDRGLLSSMTEQEIAKLKVYGKTAIPKGKYEVVITFSNRFKTYLPLLLNVKGYAGVRMHPGNTSEHTEGCLLPGTTKSKDFVGNSRLAFKTLFAKMKAVEKKEKITITIE